MMGVQIEFKHNIKKAKLAIVDTRYELLLYPTEHYDSWLAFDNLTLEEVVSKINE